MEKVKGTKTYRQQILELIVGDEHKRFTNGRYMDGLPKLGFEKCTDIWERIKSIYGYGDDAESYNEAYTFSGSIHNTVPFLYGVGVNPYGATGKVDILSFIIKTSCLSI